MTEPKRKSKNGSTEILIVEDSPTQAARLEHILRQAGYKVTAASNGKEALAGIGRRKPTLVISDILMPVMDGYELCKRLKADASLSAIPVILLTSLTDPTDVVRGLECGADYFITKPYDEKLLISRVHAVRANEELRKTQKLGMGVEILIAGQKYFITSDRMQILDFLISTYETAVQQNRELTKTRDELDQLNGQLEEKVKQRTSELIAEVAQRIKAEEKIERLNMVLHALRNINQLITKENDRDKLLKGACDTMTQTRGYRSAWIALFDDAGKLLFTTESGLGKAFQPVLKQLQQGELTECGRHALNQPGLFIKDPSTDCRDCPLAKTSGEKLVIVARLNHGTKTYGMLAAYLPIDVPPNMDEQSLFQELVDDIAFGLHKIELQEQRKKAEKDVVIAAEKYRALVENINDVLLLLDTQGNITYVSPVIERLSKYKVSDLIGKSFAQLIYPDDLPDLLDRFNRLMDGELKPWEFRAVDKDGRVIFVCTSSRPLYEDGQVMGITTLMTDITERKLSEEKLLKSYESLKKALNDAINTMVKIVEMRDPYTAGHQQRVADLATSIAREMKLEDTRINDLRTAAVIHDIGKIYIPSDILSRPGKLSDIEFSLIKTHAQSGYDIVKGMDLPAVVAQAILQHHERLDGSGYPNGLKSEDTLLEAKILAVADVVEAMAAHRPYRSALGIDKALEEISKNSGRLYDPAVVDTCLDLFNSGTFEFKAV
jgi:PAS domain S-box-containing protein/putative nucleotidyltransferase with HDIG domain